MFRIHVTFRPYGKPPEETVTLKSEDYTTDEMAEEVREWVNDKLEGENDTDELD